MSVWLILYFVSVILSGAMIIFGTKEDIKEGHDFTVKKLFCYIFFCVFPVLNTIVFCVVFYCCFLEGLSTKVLIKGKR